MFLRGARLGRIDEDVLEFISSRDADLWIAQADLLVDRAHLVMLQEQGLISSADCSRIIAALDRIDVDALGEGEDIHEAIESHVISLTGEAGGRMHTGRSRNDEVATCIRLALREQVLYMMDELLSLTDTLLGLADRNKETVIPGFTHTQHAQPTTLAHHLLAHCDALLRDFDRMADAYRRINLSPLGSAAFASTGFPIDRHRTCSLLGFDGLIENSMDAVSSRDFMLEVLSDLSILMVDLSKMAEEIILWSTSEFSYLEIDNMYASTSSIMPQKKNPDTAELVRAKTGSVAGCLMAALTINKALPMSYNRDLQEMTPNLWRAVGISRSSLRIMNGCYTTAVFHHDRLKESASSGFSTATELADSLVRVTGIPFRKAHTIVGTFARENCSPSLEQLDEVAFRIAAVRPSEIGYSQSDLDRALDPSSNVAIRSRPGGPAPDETARMIAVRMDAQRGRRRVVDAMSQRASSAIEILKAMR